MCIWLYMCICVSLCVYYAYLYLSPCVSGSEIVSMCVCVSLYVSVYIHVCIFTCMFSVSPGMSVYASVSLVCVWEGVQWFLTFEHESICLSEEASGPV